ncbi:expressed protein [Dictyostelium purpureum]|uniref:Expressed protein n=1 Tax=Dictyostelium purpureum TaxID=5786 RepID=F0ZTU9_DICPU|nr:uncharacterized protein DICPUDRAFT_95233 [Dictyostelium purpureum]EGC32639.1 expressed protein [Dictyostelium purpureum]|eukprot:XP_003290854.1 expressed protein [Dictyostelium purpureum]
MLDLESLRDSINDIDKNNGNNYRDKRKQIREKKMNWKKMLKKCKGYIANKLTNYTSKENDFRNLIIDLLEYFCDVTVINKYNYRSDFNQIVKLSRDISVWNEEKNEIEIRLTPGSLKGSRRPDILFVKNKNRKKIIMIEVKFFFKFGTMYRYYLNGKKKFSNSYKEVQESASRQNKTLKKLIIDKSRREPQNINIKTFTILGYKCNSKIPLVERINKFGIDIQKN